MPPHQDYLQWKAQVKAKYTSSLKQQPSIKYRYYRFVPTALREGGGDWYVQLSQIHIKHKGKILKAVAATNPGGSNPANERPEKAIDGQTNTKWLDHNRLPLILDFGQPAVEMDAYSFVTANDCPHRDAISWRLEGSNDGHNWDLLDERENQQAQVPVARHQPLADLTPKGLQIIPPAPIPLPELHAATEANDLVKMQELLESGAQVDEPTKDGVGRTPIFYARTKEAMALLVKFKANLNAKEVGPDQRNPLQRAVERKSEEEIINLIAFGANNTSPQVTTSPVDSARLESAQQEAQQLLKSLEPEPLPEISSASSYWEEFDQHVLESLKYMSKEDWSNAKAELEKARRLLKEKLNDDPRAPNLDFHLFSLYLICLQKPGATKEKIQIEYFQQRGIIQYFQPYSLEFPLTLILPKSLCSQNSSLLTQIQEVYRPLYNKFSTPLKEIRAILKEYADKYKTTNKQFYAGLDDKKLGIPTVIEALLASHDAYERTKTSAKSTVSGCSQYTPPATTPSLASMGWELLLTARESGLYQDNQYFGKVYVNHEKKLVMLANKGTDNYEDGRADFELFKRRVPENYLKQANALLTAAKSKLQSQGKGDYGFYITGHSLGGGMTELLSCQHGMPGITFDSPGMWEVIEADNKKQTQAGQAPRFPIRNLKFTPVTGILTKRNLVNTTNRHVGRLLKVPHGWFVASKIAEAFTVSSNITPSAILSALLKTAGADTIEALLKLYLSQPTFDALSQDVVKAYLEVENTFKTHLLDNCLLPFMTKAYANYLPHTFDEIVSWPTGHQDGTTQPLALSFRERCMPLNCFDAETRLMLANAHLIRQRSDFLLQYQDFKTLLGAIVITDKFSGNKYALDHITVTGLITGDQFRLYLHNLMTLPQHQPLQQYLKRVIKELTTPPAPAPAMTTPVVPAPAAAVAAPARPSTSPLPPAAAAPATVPTSPQSTSILGSVDTWIQAHPYWTAVGSATATLLLTLLLTRAASPPDPGKSFGSKP